MFKCIECGCEYEIKPDYCECGNDVFEEVKPAAQPKPQQQASAPQQRPAVNNIPPQRNIPHIQARPIQIERPKTFDEQYPQISRFKKSLDPISVVIFIFCLIMAFCTLFFIGNPKESVTTNNQTQTEQKPVENIPNVDSYWDNTPVVVKQVVQPPVAQPQPVPVQKDVTDPIMSKFEQWLNKPLQKQVTAQSPVQTQLKPTVINNNPKPITVKTVQPAQSKPQTVQKTVVQTQKPQTKNKTTVSANGKTNSPGAPNDLLARVQQNIQYNNTQNKTTITMQQKPATTKTNTAVQTPKMIASNNNTTPVQAPALRNATKQPVKSQAQLNQEVASYKASLRNNIGKKINFLNVVGDGSCAITFKVDSSGRLTNRSFSSQSSNITLNDAVYSAMMSTPSYNPPPEGYKNETMTLRVKIYDGNYEVTLN